MYIKRWYQEHSINRAGILSSFLEGDRFVLSMYICSPTLLWLVGNGIALCVCEIQHIFSNWNEYLHSFSMYEYQKTRMKYALPFCIEELGAQYLYDRVCICSEYVQNQWHLNGLTFVFVYNGFLCFFGQLCHFVCCFM